MVISKPNISPHRTVKVVGELRGRGRKGGRGEEGGGGRGRGENLCEGLRLPE